MDTGPNQASKYKSQLKSTLSDVSQEDSVGLKGKDYHQFSKSMEAADMREDEKDMEEVTSASSSGAYSSPFGGEFKPKKTKSVKRKSSTLQDMAKDYLQEYVKLLEDKEREDYVVVDMRNLRPLMMNYGDGQYYEKWQTELDAQKSADDLNRAYQKTYGAVEGPHVVMYKSDYFTEKRTQEELNSEEELDEVTGASSSGSFEGPAIWAKNKKNWRAVNDPNFPKYGGPGSTFVKVKKKCSRFPYCNQGDINALEFYEDKKLNEAITSVSKKTGKSISYLKNIIIKELEDSATAKKLRKQAKDRVRKYTKKEIEEIIRRPFYKSPITNLVGNAKMDLPIGKLYTMKGNKPKYEG